MDAVQYKCPNCGGGLIFDAVKQDFICEYCDSVFKEEDFFIKDETLKNESPEPNVLQQRHRPEGIGQVADIEADLQIIAVTGDGALVLGVADGGGGPEHQHLIAEGAADRGLKLLGDDQTHALDGAGKIAHICDELDRAARGDHLFPVQEVAVQQTANQSRAADLEQDVLGAQGKDGILLGIGENLLHFLQGLGGDHEGQRPAGGLLGMPGPAGQTEAVDSDGGNGVVLHLKPDTGVDGAGLIFGDGEDGAADELFQGILGNADAPALANIGQIGVILGIFGGDGEGEFIVGQGAKPSFLNYHGFPGSACVSVNSTVIHGIPGGYVLKDGDIVSIDVGAYFKGFHGDCAATFPCGTISAEAEKLIAVTKQSFFEGIRFAKLGHRVSDISHAIQTYVESNGFSVVRSFVGHGVGAQLHEEPEVPNFGNPGRGPRLLPGMTLAIEPMVNAGTHEVRVLKGRYR